MNSKLGRVAVNCLARGLSFVMARNGSKGAFAVSANGAYFQDQDGIKFKYHFSELGAAGNIDSGGDDERTTRLKLLEFLPANGTFYDIGAHEGLFSLFVMSQRPQIRTFSFEPLPENLIENIKLNGFLPDLVQAVAVGASNGVANITIDARSSNHVAAKPNGRVREVPIVSLDDYIETNNLPTPDVIKIDIEGMEPAAMLGARTILTKSNPVVICEINHCFHRYQTDLRPFIAQMAEIGYGFHKLTNRGELEVIGDIPEQASGLPFSADYNYWFMPRS